MNLLKFNLWSFALALNMESVPEIDGVAHCRLWLL